MSYRVRTATVADADVLVRHRIGMFTDMAVPFDAAALDAAFRVWLGESMTAGVYHAWLVESDARAIAAGGGVSILPWPPGPGYLAGRIGVVYNVYTEPEHRRRGLARLVMNTIHDWAARNGIGSVALNASADGRHLYDSLGYQLPDSPMMFCQLSGYNPSA
jgi:GNAT superfamily N-acetyltransferase